MRNKQQSTNNTDEEEEEQQHLQQLPQIVGSKNVHKRQILFLWPFMILLDIDT